MVNIRKNILEQDINDLFKRINKEKELKENRIIMSESNIFKTVYRMEYVSEKNYSNYRKLIDSLSKLYNTYKQLDYENYNTQFVLSLISRLEEETENVHDLMRDSLKNERDDQYRCLSDSYIKLIDLVGNISRDIPYDGNEIMNYALTLTGIKYVWGGETEQGFDCSGFTKYVFEHFGLDIGRTTCLQITQGKHVDKSDLKEGDLVFFGNIELPHQVGIYIGKDSFINAPKTGNVVKVSKMENREDYVTGRRII